MQPLPTETLYPSETTGEHLALGTLFGFLLGFLIGACVGGISAGLPIGTALGVVLGARLHRHARSEHLHEE
jgi:hypothetical protein